jgi:hypothetical protein
MATDYTSTGSPRNDGHEAHGINVAIERPASHRSIKHEWRPASILLSYRALEGDLPRFRSCCLGRISRAKSVQTNALEHVPEKWPHFSDKDMLQLFELARILDRSGDSTRSEYALMRPIWLPPTRGARLCAADGRVLLLAGSDQQRPTQDTPDRDTLTRDRIRARLADGSSPPAQKPNPT